MTSPTYHAADDLIDRIVGLSAGSDLHATRHQREKVAAATQGSYDTLFDPALPDVPLVDRLLIALYACVLTPAPALADHYRQQLVAVQADPALIAAVGNDTPESVAAVPLQAMLRFTRTLILDPVKGDKQALLTLPAAGISTPAVVVIAQLIAFLSYQIRLVASLKAMKAVHTSERAA